MSAADAAEKDLGRLVYGGRLAAVVRVGGLLVYVASLRGRLVAEVIDHRPGSCCCAMSGAFDYPEADGALAATMAAIAHGA